MDVAEHECRALEPRNPPQRREVGLEMEVAVALVPARHPVPGLRIHLHVKREQVVAALEPMLGALLEEELRLLALAEQPALHVGERSDDRVDPTGVDLASKLVQRQHAVTLEREREPARPAPAPVRPMPAAS